MELDKFVEQYHPKVLESYKRYLKGWDSLKLGTMVRLLKSLRPSVKMNLYQIYTVKEVNTEYVKIYGDGRFFIIYKDIWWEYVEIVGD